MSDETPVLTAEKREHTGSRYSRRIRSQGGLPAIVYGHKQEPVPVTLDAKQTLIHIARGEKVYTLKIEGGVTETVLLRDLQYDYLGTNIVHLALSRVDLNERVSTNIPIHLVGEAVGMKTAGATLMRAITELELECQVTNIPDAIEIDITDLEVGQAIHAKDVKLPKDTMVLLSDPNAEVAHIVFHHITEEVDADEAGEVSDQAAPEVITEKKEDGEEG
ncbi:MAG: 50S ribosomal protein L25 [Phycisphaerales bacterium]|nr:50S ribosomal protein L25 [Phycisphaerales bacterium]